jgi:hypothetical protein
MPIEQLIKRVGRDVKIIRDGTTMTITKAKINTNNTMDLFSNEQIRSGDIVLIMDTNSKYTVMNVNPQKDESGKTSHIMLHVQTLNK